MTARSLPVALIVILILLLTPIGVTAQPRDPVRSSQQPIDDATRALFDYDTTADLGLEIRRTTESDGYTHYDLTYDSLKGGRVPAFLFVPEKPGPHAGLIVMHGLPGSRKNMEGMGRLYVKTGAVVLIPSAPFSRSDLPRKDPVLFTDQDRDEQIQLIVDLRRAVDLLQGREDVDPKRIGYIGGSYGAAMGGLLAGLEPRIGAYCLLMGDGGLVEHFTGEESGSGPLDRLEPQAKRAWIDAMTPIEPLRFVAHATSPILFQNGRRDRAVPPADAERFHRAGSEPKTVKWYDSGHSPPREAILDQAQWLQEKIGIDASQFVFPNRRR